MKTYHRVPIHGFKFTTTCNTCGKTIVQPDVFAVLNDKPFTFRCEMCLPSNFLLDTEFYGAYLPLRVDRDRVPEVLFRRSRGDGYGFTMTHASRIDDKMDERAVMRACGSFDD